MTELTKDEAKAAATAAAWTDSEGRTTLHSFLDPFGADHDLEGDGKVYFYDVKRPIEVSP